MLLLLLYRPRRGRTERVLIGIKARALPLCGTWFKSKIQKTNASHVYCLVYCLNIRLSPNPNNSLFWIISPIYPLTLLVLNHYLGHCLEVRTFYLRLSKQSIFKRQTPSPQLRSQPTTTLINHHLRSVIPWRGYWVTVHLPSVKIKGKSTFVLQTYFSCQFYIPIRKTITVTNSKP